MLYTQTANTDNIHYHRNMKPYLPYLILARDIIRDESTKETSAIRIFDTIFIPKGETSFIYSFYIFGRLYLNTVGIFPNVEVKIKISDPNDTEILTETLKASNINGELSINLTALLLLVKFSVEGRYTIRISVSTDGNNFIELNTLNYFQVVKRS